MQLETFVLSISVSMQFLAAILALGLIRVTGWLGAWVLIALAVLLMAVRRSITLYKFVSGQLAIPPDLTAELVALAISVLMVVGLAWVIPLFLTMKNARRRIEESESRYRTVLDNMGETFYRTNADGLVEMVSPAITDLFGYTVEESIGIRLADLYKEPDGREKFLAALVAGGGRVSNFEAVMLHKQGNEVWVSTNARLLKDDQGRITGVEGVVRNITEQKTLSLQLQQSQKIEAIGRLAGGIAHDFNNLLQAIVGYTELMLEQTAPGSPLRKHLNMVLDSADKGARLTSQILAFSRQEVLKPKVVNLAHLVSGQLEMLQRLIGETTAVRFLNTAHPFWVSVDAGMIEQVVLNLCLNARDAMPGGGRIDIELYASEIGPNQYPEMSGHDPGPYVELRVRDTGVGIAPEIRDKIFEPFFTTKEVGEGTGLGLSMIFGIAEQHNGFIVVDSTPGMGTTFRLFLPRSDPPPETLPAAREDERTPSNSRGGETVLVAEDDPSVQELVGDVLRNAGYGVIAAGDGREALEILNREAGNIDLFLLDVVMPGMSGRELYNHIQEIAPGKPVIFSTGYTAQAMDTGFLPEMSRYLIRKPYSPKALLGMIRDALDEAPPVRSAP